MQSFLLQRLAPFFLFTLIIELGSFGIMALTKYQLLDWSLVSMTDTLGILLVTTFVSFLYLMIPYVLYLLLLPPRLAGSRFDQAVTTTGYTVYVFCTMWEEIFSFIWWKEYGAALDANVVNYLEFPEQTLHLLYEEFPLAGFAAGVIGSTVAIVWLTRRFLITRLPMPAFGRKLFHTMLYAAICLLTYQNIDLNRLETGNNYFNNELAKEGTYSLFSSIWEWRHEQNR